MADNIHYLHGRPRRIANYTRVGFSEHRRIEQLLSAGVLAADRFVIDASSYKRQTSLVRTLKDEHAEIVLDTNVAELSAAGRFGGATRYAPWAADNRPLERDDFVVGTNRSVIEPIGRFAIENGVDVVMAPTHYMGDEQSWWFAIDQNSCVELRKFLDSNGGETVKIDYPLIITYAQLRKPETRKHLLDGLRDLPFDNLWLRVSGFGADATAAGVERYVQAVLEFHQLGKPIITDQVGGLTSLAISSFGASSGFAHAITGKERFSAQGWINPKPSKGGGRGDKTVYIPGLDRRIKVKDARAMFDDARTSRGIFGCPDKNCCGDIDKMLSNPEAHFVRQRNKQVRELSIVPESIRAERFVTDHVEEARRRADRGLKLKKPNEDTKKLISKSHKRLIRFEQMLTNMHEHLGPIEFAPEATKRSGKVNPSGKPFEQEGRGHE